VLRFSKVAQVMLAKVGDGRAIRHLIVSWFRRPAQNYLSGMAYLAQPAGAVQCRPEELRAHRAHFPVVGDDAHKERLIL